MPQLLCGRRTRTGVDPATPARSAPATSLSASTQCRLDRKWICGSGDQGVNDLAVDVREPEVAARVAVGQPFVVEAEQAELGRVEVVNMDLVRDRGEAE